jgi:glutathionylspermidine synthase
MIRKQISPRSNWQKKLEDLGFLFHTPEGQTYWNESVCYEFSADEIDILEKSTNDLQEICAQAVQTVIDKGWYSRLGISDFEANLIQHDWNNDRLSIYGRFDLSWNLKDPPKMLEYNADTPTSLYEAAVIQWYWLKDVYPQMDQFNSIHERLIKRWSQVADKSKALYFTCLQNNADDITQTEYLRDTAHQAGFKTDFIFIEDLGFNTLSNVFVDLEAAEVRQCFKLYPWEWLVKEEFGKLITPQRIHFIEPAWKRIMSTKAFLAILWELFPNHPNLLPTFFNKPDSGKFVEKPFLSREGNNIKVWDQDSVNLETEGYKESDKSIYQAYHPLPNFDGHHAVIGSWIIGEESAGISIREDVSVITQSSSQFIPHFFNSSRR